MWGATPPRAKLTGDSGNAFEAALICDLRSFRTLAENQPLCLLGLLQHYRHEPDLPTERGDVRFREQSGKHLLAASISPFETLTGLRKRRSKSKVHPFRTPRRNRYYPFRSTLRSGADMARDKKGLGKKLKSPRRKAAPSSRSRATSTPQRATEKNGAQPKARCSVGATPSTILTDA
jgi:hypothetical protein